MGNAWLQLQKYDIVRFYKRSDWLPLCTKQHYQLIRHKLTQQTAQLYQLRDVPSIEDMNIYDFRSKQQLLVKVYFIAFEHQIGICGNNHAVEILVQHIPYKFDQLAAITQQQALTLFVDALKGFDFIEQHFGAVEPSEQLMGINEEGKLKVWLNSNPTVNTVDKHSKQSISDKYSSVSIRVRKLYRTVEQKCIDMFLPYYVKYKFCNRHISHANAIQLVQQYTKSNHLSLSKYLPPEIIKQRLKNRTHNLGMNKKGNNQCQVNRQISFADSFVSQHIPQLSEKTLKKTVSLINMGRPQSSLNKSDSTNLLNYSRVVFNNPQAQQRRTNAHFTQIRFVHHHTPTKIFYSPNYNSPHPFTNMSQPLYSQTCSSREVDDRNQKQLQKQLQQNKVQEKHLKQEKEVQFNRDNNAKQESMGQTENHHQQSDIAIVSEEQLDKHPPSQPLNQSGLLLCNERKQQMNKQEQQKQQGQQYKQQKLQQKQQGQQYKQQKLQQKQQGQQQKQQGQQQKQQGQQQKQQMSRQQENERHRQLFTTFGNQKQSELFNFREKYLAKFKQHAAHHTQPQQDIQQATISPSFNSVELLNKTQVCFADIHQQTAHNIQQNIQAPPPQPEISSNSSYQQSLQSFESKELDKKRKRTSIFAAVEIDYARCGGGSQRADEVKQVQDQTSKQLVFGSFSKIGSFNIMRIDSLLEKKYEQVIRKEDKQNKFNTKTHRKDEQSISQQPQQQDFLNVDYLEKSLEKRYSPNLSKRTVQKQSQEEDVLNIEKLEEGLLKFSKYEPHHNKMQYSITVKQPQQLQIERINFQQGNPTNRQARNSIRVAESESYGGDNWEMSDTSINIAIICNKQKEREQSLKRTSSVSRFHVYDKYQKNSKYEQYNRYFDSSFSRQQWRNKQSSYYNTWQFSTDNQKNKVMNFNVFQTNRARNTKDYKDQEFEQKYKRHVQLRNQKPKPTTSYHSNHTHSLQHKEYAVISPPIQRNYKQKQEELMSRQVRQLQNSREGKGRLTYEQLREILWN